MRNLAALLLLMLLALASCSAFHNRKVEQPVTYRMRMEDFEGKVTVLDVVEIEGKVHLYLIVTEGRDLYETPPDVSVAP